jgi:cytochrome c oxidase subunit 1
VSGVSAAQDGGPGGCTTASSRSPYTLAIAADTDRSLVRGWLWLGLLALIVSGVYSILLVASRTPGINAMLPVADFFRVALVVHVDLSVLVWFLALAGMLWSLSSRPRAPALGWLALALACAGTAMLGIAPFALAADCRSWPTTFRCWMAACSCTGWLCWAWRRRCWSCAA